MLLLNNVRYTGSKNRQSLLDFHVPENFNGKIILFVHGYMGFKDWGAWNLVQNYFTDRQYGFCKFNMSHNGGTVENGIDFPDTTAFAENNYSTELRDVLHVFDWIGQQVEPLPEIHLVGHSRGGGIVLLAAKDHRVSSVTTLAGISSVARRFEGADMLAD
jgi:pimeloyl-ACP methyl ester carboxylesterase